MGELLGLGPLIGAAILLVRLPLESGGVAVAVGGLAMYALLGACEGAIVGMWQWIVLRRRLPGITRRSWVIATTAGAVAAWFLGMLPSTVISLTGHGDAPPPDLEGPGLFAMAAGMGLLLGLVLAAPQWRVLARHVAHAGWWMPANAVAWALAMPLMFSVAGLPLPQDGLLPLLAVAVATITGAGALVGAIHGAVLVRLLRNA